VANNTLLLADGRPSLCRRVPVRLTENGGRPSTTGAQRIVSAKKGFLENSVILSTIFQLLAHFLWRVKKWLKIVAAAIKF